MADSHRQFKIKAIICTSALLALFLLLININLTQAAFGDCDPGYTFNPRSGVGCVQTDCNSVANAHYSYEGYCICGSAGSINENPADPNKRCAYPREHTSCPGCVYACVHTGEDCPEPPGVAAINEPAAAPAAGSQSAGGDKSDGSGTDAISEMIENEVEPEDYSQAGVKTPEQLNTDITPPDVQDAIRAAAGQMTDLSRDLLADDARFDPPIVRAGFGDGLIKVIKRGFGYTMELVGWGTDKAFGVKINQDKNNQDAGWSGLVIMPDGDYLDVKIFEGTLKLSWSEGVGAEFNLINIKGRPGSGSFVDGFSIGIGPGSASRDEASPSLPGIPVSPNINVRNITNWFDEKWQDTKNWWNENVPWPLGSANTPNIGGGQ